MVKVDGPRTKLQLCPISPYFGSQHALCDAEPVEAFRKIHNTHHPWTDPSSFFCLNLYLVSPVWCARALSVPRLKVVDLKSIVREGGREGVRECRSAGVRERGNEGVRERGSEEFKNSRSTRPKQS